MVRRSNVTRYFSNSRAKSVRRKRKSQALKKSSTKAKNSLTEFSLEELLDLYNNAPCGCHSLDKEGTLVRINDTELKWLDYTRSEVVGKMKVTQILTAEGIRLFHENFPKLMKQGELRDIELEIVRKDGSLLPVLLSATAIRNKRGNFLMSSVLCDISQHKEFERALQKNEERTRLIIETAQDAFVSIDASGTITQWNREAEKIFGWSKNEALGKNIIDLIIPQKYHSAHFMGIQQFLSTEKGPFLNKRMELTALHRNGHEFPIEMTMAPLRLGDSYIFNAFIHDITQRKRSQESISIYGEIVKNMPMGVIVLHFEDPKNIESSRVVAVNPLACQIGNILENEAIGRKMIDLYPDLFKTVLPSLCQEVLHSGKPEDVKDFFYSDNRVSPGFFSIKIFPLANDYLGFVFEDMTQMKKIEEMKKRADQLLRQQKALLELTQMDIADLQTLLQKITEIDAKTLRIGRVGVWFFNDDRTELICKNMYKLSEGSHEKGLRLKVHDYPHYFQAIEESLLLAANDACKDPRTSEFASTYLVPAGITSMMDVPVRLYGKVAGIVCHEHVGPAREWAPEEQDFATSIAEMVSLALVVSELLKTEETLKEKTEELKRSNKELEQFAYVASHDLQEPLYIITAFVDKIKTKYGIQIDLPIQHLLDRIQNAANRMSQLTQDLLQFARVTTRTKPFEAIPLTPLIQEIIADLHLRLKESKGQIEVDLLPAVYADRSQMRRLFQNLITNALKFHRKEIPPQVFIRNKGTKNGFVEISIEDNGIGFEPQYAERIFLPFQRLHPRSQYEGTGMGLAICQKIVQRHQGEIMAQSISDKGSTFMMSLPLAKREGEIPL